jgi:hypothetical protein
MTGRTLVIVGAKASTSLGVAQALRMNVGAHGQARDLQHARPRPVALATSDHPVGLAGRADQQRVRAFPYGKSDASLLLAPV